MNLPNFKTNCDKGSSITGYNNYNTKIPQNEQLNYLNYWNFTSNCYQKLLCHDNILILGNIDTINYFIYEWFQSAMKSIIQLCFTYNFKKFSAFLLKFKHCWRRFHKIQFLKSDVTKLLNFTFYNSHNSTKNSERFFWFFLLKCHKV